MSTLFYILFAIGVFSLSLIGYKKYFSIALYALAIGGLVNSTYFTAEEYPINVFNTYLGIDSIIYCLFLFSIIMMFLRFGKKDAHKLCGSSVVAVIFTSFMELLSALLSNKHNNETFLRFLSLLVISVATISSIVVIVSLLGYLKKKINNEYILMVIGLLAGSVVKSAIFGIGNALVYQRDIFNEMIIEAPVFIAIGLSIICSLLIVFITRLIDKHKKPTNE